MKKLISMFILFNLCLLPAQTFNGIQYSLYSDIKAHEVGDVVLVMIAENANAKQESNSNSSSDADFKLNGGITGNLTNFFPAFGASSGIKNSYNGRAQSAQKEQLTGKITATIIEKSDNGMLRIKGERIIEVNGEKNIMELEGLVRSRDIGSDNKIYSYNIADAKIIYKKAGLGNKISKPGRLKRFSTYAFGLGLVAVALLSGVTI